MSQENFDAVVGLVEDNPTFHQECSGGRQQCPVAHQVLVALEAFGTELSRVSNPGLQDAFSTGRGTNTNHIWRVAKVLQNRQNE